MKTKTLTALALVGILAIASGCTNPQGESESPVFITVDLEEQPGFVNVAVPAAVQVDTIILSSELKDPTAADPQGMADAQINSYRVTFTRTDGGTIVPPAQTFGCGVVVPSGGEATLNNFPVVYATAIQQSPFDQLLPFNGGIDRETGRDEIDMAFNLTFYGTTVSGKRVQSQTASGILIFQYSAVAGLTAKTAR
jgi:hypothetical protein